MSIEKEIEARCSQKLTAEQKIKLLNIILESVKDWRLCGRNAHGPCIPDSVLDALRILFPNGV